jgi:hypothetical protein
LNSQYWEMAVNMRSDTVMEELLDSACPSIQYRLRLEVLGQPAASPVMLALQDQILHDPAVQAVLSWQGPDGWLAWDFHGARSHETGIRILCEKGVHPRHPALARALGALERYTDRLERGLGKPGRLLDQLGFGGTAMIRAALFAYAGMEEIPCVGEQVLEALAGFNAVLEVESIQDIVEVYKGRLVFRPGVRWPGIYHLRLLAFTQGWRTAENLSMLVNAVRRLGQLSPIPVIHVRNKSKWIAPASFCMHDFNPDMESMDAAGWMMWFHRSECLARLGVIPSIPALKRQVDSLSTLSEAEPGWFTRQLNHPYFAKWSAYTGLRLEPDWRHLKNREVDLTFRRLLILHYGS